MDWLLIIIAFALVSLTVIGVSNRFSTSKLSKLSTNEKESSLAIGMLTARNANEIIGRRFFSVGEGPIIFQISPKEIRLYSNPEASKKAQSIPLGYLENWHFETGYTTDTWRMLGPLDKSAPIGFEKNGRRHKVALLRWERDLEAFRPMDTWHERELLERLKATSGIGAPQI
jgi:hypothetical protein